MNNTAPRTDEMLDSEIRLRLALDAGKMGAWEWNLQTGQVLWSTALEAIHGLAPGTFGGTIDDYGRDVHPEDRELVRNSIQRSLESGEHHVEYRIIWPAGSVHWVEGRGRLFRDASGTPARMVGVCTDVTLRKRAGEALKSKEAELALIAHATPLALTRCSRERRYLFANDAAATLFGLPLDRIVGRPVPEVMGENAYAVAVPHIEKVLLGQTVEYEAEFDFRTAGPRWMRVNYIPDRDERGEIAGWIATILDITERKREEQKSRFLADASAALAELTDKESTLQKIAGVAVPHFADWCAVFLNHHDGTVRPLAMAHTDPAKAKVAREMFARYPVDPDAPRGTGCIARTGKPELLEDIPEEALSTVARDADHLNMARTVGLRSYLGVPLVSRGGKILGVLDFVAAESGRRFRRADLWLAQDLARRAVIAIENAELYRAMKEADRRKDEFLAILAHELRNPLAPVRNASHYLKLKELDDSDLERPVEMIDRQVTHMARLIDDLLDVSRISRGVLELRRERLTFVEVVEAALDASAHEIAARGHDLRVSMPTGMIELEADRARMAQVFGNLILNAAKYTPAPGRIEVGAVVKRGFVEATVRDNGIGIPSDKLTEIFDLFARVDHSLERQGGLGIGLTLARQLMELHGGTIEARSEGIGHGSEFVIRIPILTAPRLRAPVEAPLEAPKTARRILVADDNPDAVDSLVLLLQTAGHEVHGVYDGASAVAAVRAFQPDIVLLDIGMPKLNGYEAARQIRLDPWGRSLFLVALTGWGQGNDRALAREAGFDLHLVKPVDPKLLFRVLAEGIPAPSPTPTP